MVYRRYCSPFEEQKCPPKQKQPEIIEQKNECAAEKSNNNIFGNLGCDDIILIGLILILLLDDGSQKDFPLIIALGFLLICGWQDIF